MSQNRIGKTKVMKSGQIATIVKYNNVNDIDVLLEEGIVVCKKNYNDFVNGNIEVKAGDKTYVPTENTAKVKQLDGACLGFINMRA